MIRIRQFEAAFSGTRGSRGRLQVLIHRAAAQCAEKGREQKDPPGPVGAFSSGVLRWSIVFMGLPAS